jgi:hypothetical protein
MSELEPGVSGQSFRPNLDIMARHIIQSIIQEMPESLGTTGMADAVYERLDQIDRQNGLHPLLFENVYWMFVDDYNNGVD